MLLSVRLAGEDSIVFIMLKKSNSCFGQPRDQVLQDLPIIPNAVWCSLPVNLTLEVGICAALHDLIAAEPAPHAKIRSLCLTLISW